MKISVFRNPRFFAPVLLSLMIVSCQKKTDFLPLPKQTDNYIVRTQDDSKTEQEFTIFVNMGHDAKNCNGCVMRHGRLIHVDCQGHGNACAASSRVTLYVGGSDIYAVTTDTFGLTDESFFNMPARSLYTEDEKGQPVYLNIPAQLVYRDSTTLQFTFTGLYYTESPDYAND